MSEFEPSALARAFGTSSTRPAPPPPGTILLGVGDPDFATPEYIRRALADAVEQGATHYGTWGGDPELRAALAAQASRRAGRPISDEQVVMTHGGGGALSACVLTVAGPGKRVVVISPAFPPYVTLVRASGAEPVQVPHRPGDYHLDLDALAKAAEGACLIMLCHPSNPTSAVYTRAELEALAGIAERNDLWVLSDEAYDHVLATGVTFTSALEVPALADRLLYVQTFSKTYAMTGWRLGYVIAPPGVAGAIGSLHRGFTGSLNPAIQRAGLAAITGPQDDSERMMREYETRRELVGELLHGTPGVSLAPAEAVFYAWVRLSPQLDADWVQTRLAERGVVVRPGKEFGPGGENHLRIALSAPRDVLTTAIGRLREVIEEGTRQ